jgi:hypothetical protein
MTTLRQVPMPITVQPTVNVQHVSALFSEVQTARLLLQLKTLLAAAFCCSERSRAPHPGAALFVLLLTMF